MGANTYSNKPNGVKTTRRSNAAKKRGSVNRAMSLPKWAPFAAAGVITVMVCLTVNFRAFTELRSEVKQQEELNQQIESLTSDNITLQEEIHSLKSDGDTIKREARKLGLIGRDKKVSVPANK